MKRISWMCFVCALLLSNSLWAQTPTPAKKSTKAKKSKRFEPPPEPPREILRGVPVGVPGEVLGPPPEKKWITFNAPDESFSILMPGTPQARTQIVESPLGKVPMQVHISIAGVTGYTIAYGDMPTNIDSPDYAQTALAAARDRIATMANAKIVSDKEITYEQFPGREVKFQTPTVTAINRTYYVNNRLYQIQVLVPTAMGDPSDYSQRFFESFKVLKITEKNMVADADLQTALSPPPNFFDKPVEWRERSFSEAGFKAVLPRDPFQVAVTINPNDKRAIEHVVFSKGEHGYFLVSYQDFLTDVGSPEARTAIYAGTKSLITQSMREALMNVTAESNYTFKNFTGKEYKIESAPGLIKLSGLCRTILVHRRTYTWMAIYPDTASGNEETKKFMDSFQILDIPPTMKILAPPPPKMSSGTKLPQAAPNALPPPAPLQAYPLEAWQIMQYPQVGFAASFPAKPVERIKPAARNGAQRVSTEYKVVTKDGTYSVTLTQLIGQGIAPKEEVKQSLREILKSLKQGPYKWLGGKEIELEGFPGIEYQYQYLQFQEVSWQRMLFVDDRIYTIIADRPLNKPEAKEPKLFMESFKLLALSPAGISALPLPPPPAPGQTFGQGLKPAIIRVSGGVLIGAAIKKVQPRYPSEALSARATGAVEVSIVVSEEGKVVEATAISGSALLREAAISAAKQWLFKPIELSGAPVKFQGVLTFNFTLQ